MSKVIYLDGTETLIFTRQLVEPGYMPRSPMMMWEAMVLHGVASAGRFPNQQVVVDFSDLPPTERPDYDHMVEEFIRHLMRALRMPGHLMNVYASRHVAYITINTPERLPQNHPDYLDRRIKWPITKSIP